MMAPTVVIAPPPSYTGSWPQHSTPRGARAVGRGAWAVGGELRRETVGNLAAAFGSYCRLTPHGPRPTPHGCPARQVRVALTARSRGGTLAAPRRGDACSPPRARTTPDSAQRLSGRD